MNGSQSGDPGPDKKSASRIGSGIRSISRRLALGLTTAVGLVSVITFLMLYLGAVHEEEVNLMKSADASRDYLVGALELPLWNYDKPTVQTIGRTLSQNEFVAGLVIKDASGSIVQAVGKGSESDGLNRTGKIYHQGRLLGEVQIFFTKRYVKEAARGLLFAYATTMLFVLISLALLTHLFLRKFLKEPIDALNRIVRPYADGIYDLPVAELPYVEFQAFGRILGQMGETIRLQMKGIKDAEEKYHSIFENAREGIFQCTPEGRYLSANPALARIHGYDSAEALMARVNDIGRQFYVNPRDWERFLKAVETNGYVEGFEADEYRKDGSRISVSINARRVSGQDGATLYYEGSVADITGRKQTEEALRQLTLFQRTILDNVAYGVISANPDGIVTSFNPAAERLLGYAASEVVGQQSPARWHDPEEMARHARQLSEELGAAILPGFEVFAARPRRKLPEENEWTFIRKDGRRIPVNLSVTALRDESDRITGFVGLTYDLTERKRVEASLRASEEKYRTLIQKIQAAVIVHGADTKILTSNSMAQEILGLSQDQLLGKMVIDPAWHFFREDGTVAALADYPVSRVRASRKALRNYVLGVHRPDQENDAWVLVNADPVFDKENELTQIIVTFIDISERKRVEDALSFVAQRGWQASGENFFDALAQFLGEKLEMDYVLIDRLDENPDMAETVALYAKGAITPNMRYALKGTPCENVMGRRLCVYPHGIQQLFPEDSLLPGMGAESYIGIPLWDSTGQPIGLIAVMSSKPLPDDAPVTQLLQLVATRAAAELERERSNRLLRVREHEYRTLAENSPDVIVRYDRQGRRIYVNPEFERVNHLTAQQVLGKTPAELSTNLQPRADVFTQQLMAAMASGKLAEVDLSWTVEGKPVCWFVRVVPEFDAAGEVTSALTIWSDISERKQAEEEIRQLNAELEQRVLERTHQLTASEERMRQFFERQLVGMAITSPEKGWVQVNDKLCEMMGYSRGELLRLSWAEMTYPEDLTADVAQFERMLRGEIDNYMLEKRFVRKNGSLVFTNLAVGCVRRVDRSVDYVLALLEDITERKQAEDSIRKLNQQLLLARDAAEAANKAKSVFLASMSHELRTPLNAVLGFSNMMRKDPLLQPEQRENLDIINRSGEHLLTLINDVLEMAKIEAGRVQVERAPFDLGSLVRDVTDMMHVRAQEKGLQLVIDQSSQFPRYIRGDEGRVRQVLINLLGNAVKFTRQGGVTVRFGLKPNATPQRLLIEVEDSGIGIGAEDQKRVFEPFVQFGETAAQKGTGLGLSIARQFVQLMGGTIGFESTLGKGSTFRVELPMERVAAADVLKPQSAGRGEIVGLAPGQPEYRILIVEDQLDNQLLLTRLMKNVGLQVRLAENGEQAVALFDSWRPQLIWMDRRMPVMDGLEATRRIRQLPGGREVKIVAVTASVFTEQRDEMLKVGMDDFVRKPYRFNEIYECMTKQLGVQYTYAETPAEPPVSDVVLTSRMLALLPADLRQELLEALESLEGERISAVIQQIASLDSKLHKTLSQLVGNFDYPAILKALQTQQPDELA
ncbi:MAG: PAS domain S-box protein [Rhodoferax sp.]|uniref:PAS domain S-box protein n=1 Tax=Rhodoferax sp. TaxID=50421 RepID=UPI002625B8DF|nr:PAS domain S-box protein [Rhodoferax sp.]MDD5332559.1 PAS domain S-box protein [Rhodoferax sp.]